MLDEYEHLRFLRSVEWFGRKCKIVHDVPEFREIMTPLDRISMEQDFADDLQRFSCYRDVALAFRPATQECRSADPSGPRHEQNFSRGSVPG